MHRDRESQTDPGASRKSERPGSCPARRWPRPDTSRERRSAQNAARRSAQWSGPGTPQYCRRDGVSLSLANSEITAAEGPRKTRERWAVRADRLAHRIVLDVVV